MKKVMSILVIIIAFAACKSAKNKDMDKYSTSFEEKEYQLLAIEDRDVEEMDLSLRVNPKLRMINGESGCNNYQFNYSLNEDVLDLGYGLATKMYCEETMEIENSFFGATGKVKHFSETENMLYFLDKDGKVLLKAKGKK
jgi:heat shock protein HslJ